MKKVYFSLLVLSIILLFVYSVIFAEPNTDLNVLLYSEDKEDTATHLKIYASDEITLNISITYSIIITASVPSPLGQGNVIDQGLVALVVPETAEVDYKNIKVYGAPTPESNKYIEYQPESELNKEWFNILGSIVSKIPFLGLAMDFAPIYQTRAGDYGEFIDLNQYDIVKINWEVARLKYWQKVQIDIPVHLSDNTEIGLYAYWQSRASSSDGTGPTFARDNMVDIGFNISEEKPVISEIGITYNLINGIDADFPPFTYIDNNGRPVGFDIDCVNWIAKEMGFEVKHIPVIWDGVIAELLAGKIDLIASGTTITEERKKVVDFTISYWQSDHWGPFGYAVRKEDQELKNILNKELRRLMNSPKWDEFVDKWGLNND